MGFCDTFAAYCRYRVTSIRPSCGDIGFTAAKLAASPRELDGNLGAMRLNVHVLFSLSTAST